MLRTLVAIADTKTFSAAADVVHVTHAAVSQQMQTLEADLGVALFDRSTRTPELTPVAHQIVEKARKIIADYDNLVPSVMQEGELNSVIRLGVLRTTLTGLAPQAMAQLKAHHPGMGLHLKPGLTGALLADLARGNLDVALVTKPAVMPPGVIFRTLVEEPMQLIASLEEPEQNPITLLKTRPFIRFNRSAVVGALIDNWILSKRIRVNEAMELDGLEAIASMVHANLGVSIVPDLAVPPMDPLPLNRLNLGPDAPRRTLGLIYPETQSKMRAMDALFNALAGVIAASKSTGHTPAHDI